MCCEAAPTNAESRQCLHEACLSSAIRHQSPSPAPKDTFTALLIRLRQVKHGRAQLHAALLEDRCRSQSPV